MAEDGDGEEHQKVIDGAEAGNKGAACRGMGHSRDKEVGGQQDVWEDALTFGIAGDRDELDGGV